MIATEIIKEYNHSRTCHDKRVLCHAPFTNIYFNQSGNGVACCYNSTHVLGTYPQHSISDMWFGAKAQELREAIRQNDLSGGCSGCAHQLTSRNFSGQMSVFDRYADQKEQISWFQRISRRFKPQKEIGLPKAMEFSLTNVCNLGCVMCSGYFSSVIRRDREKLPPMKSPYDLAFVEQLDEFIPSLSVAKFFGGEPFLIRIYYEIWERIRRLNPAIEVHITTNATLLTERAKALLDSLNCHLIVSIDSLQKETYEQIRKNASYEQVMQNLAYLQAYSAKHKRILSFAVCPMQQNWQELPQMVQYCNENGIVIWFNTVYHPAHCSLRSMSATELTQIVDYWNGFDLPTDNWLATSNRNRLTNVINQVTQWRDEALQNENVVSLTVSDWFLPTVAQTDDPSQEMSHVFANLLLQTQKKEAAQPNKARYGAINAGLKDQLNVFLDNKRAELPEELFMRHYFAALKDAYVFVNPHSSEQKNILSKIDTLSETIMQHQARATMAGFIVQQDIPAVLGWLENNKLEAIGPFISARYGDK